MSLYSLPSDDNGEPVISANQQQSDFERLLEYIKNHRGFDFGGYKHSSLLRRINKRMGTVDIKEYADYIDYLEVHPEEFNQLFDTILINVTSFFRDVKAWEYLNEYILPRIISSKKDHQPIRIWSAGCASGEEAYTITMLMAEHLGMDGFKNQVKVYATDLDEDALSKARLASYSESDLESVPPEFVHKYFDQVGERYVFNKELRRCVIFGRHDLIQDAPISRIDLLICRNILMYFNAETQARILTRLNYAMNDHRFLFLGKAEMMLTHANLFTPVDLKNRIFIKAMGTNIRDRLLVLAQNGHDNSENGEFSSLRIRDAAFDAGIVAQIVVDSNGYLCLINEKARSLFNIDVQELGRPFHDMEISYRPAELRSEIETIYSSGVRNVLKDVEMMIRPGEIRYLEVHLVPLKLNTAPPIGVSISFYDVTEHKRTQHKLEQTNHELETATEELQSTNEELETTNEELQSTIEELETTNEELQSTNEELETMNEELQSTNEELETLNDELNLRTGEVNKSNAFLQAIMASLHGSVMVLDNNLNLLIWNRKSEDMWGMRSEEVYGRNLFGLDIGIPLDQLKRPIHGLLNQEGKTVEMQMEAVNRRGRTITCDVTANPLLIDNEVKGVIIIFEQRVGVIEEKGNSETGDKNG